MRRIVVYAVALMIILPLTTSGCRQSERNVTNPGEPMLYRSSIDFEHHVQLKAGETKTLDITLNTQKDGPGEINYNISRVVKEYSKDKLPLPGGLNVTIEPSRFMANQNTVYHSTITVKPALGLPSGEYVLFLDWNFETVMTGGGWITVSIE